MVGPSDSSAAGETREKHRGQAQHGCGPAGNVHDRVWHRTGASYLRDTPHDRGYRSSFLLGRLFVPGRFVEWSLLGGISTTPAALLSLELCFKPVLPDSEIDYQRH